MLRILDSTLYPLNLPHTDVLQQYRVSTPRQHQVIISEIGYEFVASHTDYPSVPRGRRHEHSVVPIVNQGHLQIYKIVRQSFLVALSNLWEFLFLKKLELVVGTHMPAKDHEYSLGVLLLSHLTDHPVWVLHSGRARNYPECWISREADAELNLAGDTLEIH